MRDWFSHQMAIKRDKQKAAMIRHLFWNKDNYFWIDVSFEPTALATTCILFIEKDRMCCTNPDCPGGKINLGYKNRVLLEIDNNQLAKHLREHDKAKIVHVGLKQGAYITKRALED